MPFAALVMAAAALEAMQAAARRRRVGAARRGRAAAPRGLGVRGGVRRVAVERRGRARAAAHPRVGGGRAAAVGAVGPRRDRATRCSRGRTRRARPGRLGRQRTWDETPQAFWSALAELLKPPLAIVGGLGVALVLARRRGRRAAAIPLAVLVVGAATFAIVVLGGVSGQVPRYASIAAVALLLFAGHLVAELLRPRAGAVPRAARVAAIVLILAGGAWTASRLHPKSVTNLLGFRHDVEEDLAAVLRGDAVRGGAALRARRGPDAQARCRSCAGSSTCRAEGAVARNDPDAARFGAPGAVLLDAHEAPHPRPRLRPVRPAGRRQLAGRPRRRRRAGYAHRGHTRYFEIYTRC